MAHTAGYVSVGNIASMLTRSNKNLVVDIYDIAEWCAEVLSDIGDFDSLQFFKDEKLQVTNHQVLLPCHLYRLVSITRNNCSISRNEYSRNGAYLKFNDDAFEVTIDYLGIPVDEQGFPLVPNSHKQACYWYCMTKLYLEDYLSGKMSSDRYAEMDMKYVNYVISAKQSVENVTVNDMNQLSMIMHNMVRTVRYPRSIP